MRVDIIQRLFRCFRSDLHTSCQWHFGSKQQINDNNLSNVNRPNPLNHSCNTMLSRLAPKSDWDKPSPVYAFLTSPIAFAARTMYYTSLALQVKPEPAIPHSIRVICLSDTHTQIPAKVPLGDLLIHAGDMCNFGDVTELQAQIDWLKSLPHKHKVVISGNHDVYLDPRSRRTLPHANKQFGTLDWGNIHYLLHHEVTLTFPEHGGRRLKVYGAPQVPIPKAPEGPEHAFRYDRGDDAWSETVPSGVDILITHTPPRWHKDLPVGLGCEWLLKEIWRVRPRLHVFGHIHADPGAETVLWDTCQVGYERICMRCSKGLLAGLLNPPNWIDLTLLCLRSLRNLAWSRLWGGETSEASTMVNAALMSQETGKLVREPQVIVI